MHIDRYIFKRRKIDNTGNEPAVHTKEVLVSLRDGMIRAISSSPLVTAGGGETSCDDSKSNEET